MFTDSHAPLLSLQTAAANLTPWSSLCQHFKLDMEEAFQSNWLHEKIQNQILADAFEEAKTLSFDELLKIRQNIEGKNWKNVLLLKYEKIVTFVVMHHNSMNITLDIKEDIFRKACENGHLEMAAVLMNNAATLGIDLNSRDNEYGQTAFSWACEKGHADVVKLLMENATTMSIDLNAKSNGGNTCFHYACMFGQKSTIELLLNNACFV